MHLLCHDSSSQQNMNLILLYFPRTQNITSHSADTQKITLCRKNQRWEKRDGGQISGIEKTKRGSNLSYQCITDILLTLKF